MKLNEEQERKVEIHKVGNFEHMDDPSESFGVERFMLPLRKLTRNSNPDITLFPSK